MTISSRWESSSVRPISTSPTSLAPQSKASLRNSSASTGGDRSETCCFVQTTGNALTADRRMIVEVHVLTSRLALSTMYFLIKTDWVSLSSREVRRSGAPAIEHVVPGARIRRPPWPPRTAGHCPTIVAKAHDVARSTCHLQSSAAVGSSAKTTVTTRPSLDGALIETTPRLLRTSGTSVKAWGH